MKAQTFTTLREDKLRQNNLKKSIFDGFRQNKEEEKTTKLLHQYNEVEIPRKLAAQQTIDEVQQQGNQKHMEYAVKVIAKHLEKRVFQYFETWRKSCVTYQRVLNNQIKLRIINSYNNKLRDAFTKWIAYKGKIMLQQQSQIYQTYQEEISDQNNEIIENQNMLKEKQQKQKTQSGKQMKKIMVGAFQRQLKEKFNQWRRNQEIKLNKQNETQKLVSIMDKQLKRLAFKKYLNKVNENIKDLQNEGKVIQFLRKSSTRSVQKAFYAILGFSSNHYNAKNALGRLIKNLDRSVKENTFKQWIQYKHERQSESLQASQSTTVSQIKNLIDEAGYLQDHVENLNQLNKRSDHTIRQQAKRVIQNSFIRCHELSQRYYFSEWKTKTEKQKQVQLALKKAITHWQRKGQDYSLKLWMRRQAENKQTVLEMAIQQEEQSFSSIQNSSYKSQIKFKNEKDQCVIDLNNLQRDEAELSQKHANCISTIIKRRDNNFYQPKLQYIVQHWREYTASKKRSYQLFEKCMTKSLLEAAFSEIKLVARQNNITNNKSKAANKAINIIYKLKLRSAINQWRSSNHSIVTERQQNAEKQMQNENHKFNMVKDGLQLKLVNNQFNNRQSNILFECYHELKAYSKEQKSIKDKRNQLQQNISKRQLQVGLLKWQQRHQATLKLRQKCKKLQLRLQSLSTKSIFDGWREVFAREKRLCDCIKNIVHRADHIDLQDALGLMKNKYYQYKSYEQRSKGFAKDALQQLINGKELRLQFQAFKKYQYGVQQVNKIISHKRSILIKFLTQRARSYLKVWNDQAQKCAVKEYNNDEGPVRIEIHKLNKELHLLKKALRDEGHKDSDISIVLKSGQDRHTQLIEKAISRMYCYNNDLYLLPWCLDEWKRWLKQRKNYRRAIQLLINRCDYNRSGLGFAFRKWKQQKLQDIKRLQCLQKHQLEKQCIINCDLLEKAATQLENQTFNSEELQDQRNLLLKTFVNSQKLALAVINGGQERIKQRALSRLLTQHHNATKSEYQQVLTFNLDKINQLKEKINMLELSNHGYAEQNEELRVGALDGIDMAQGIEELSKEREKLSIDLADKAIIIRKLLEDNNNLSIRLMNAQEEAEKLIRLSQLKITNNRGYSPSRYND